MSIERVANRLQARFLHPLYRKLDGRILGIRWIYTTDEMAERGDPTGDPVASWVNHWLEHGFLVTVCLFGGSGAAIGWLLPWAWATVPLGFALGTTVGATFFWWREDRNGTLGTADGRGDAIGPTVWSLVAWALVWWLA